MVMGFSGGCDNNKDNGGTVIGHGIGGINFPDIMA